MSTLTPTPAMWRSERRSGTGPRSDAVWKRVFWTVSEWSRSACVVPDTRLIHMSGAERRYDLQSKLFQRLWTNRPCFSRQGFRVVQVEECWFKSLAPLMAEVRAQMGSGPVYLSFDIDALDPGFAPGTGTPEIGGLTPIQVKLGKLRLNFPATLIS